MAGDVGENLLKFSKLVSDLTRGKRTRVLKSAISSSVIVSALAITGMRLTRVCKRDMNSISIGRRLGGKLVHTKGVDIVETHECPVG